MADYGLPVLYALFLWWLTTGVLLFLHRLPAHTYPWSMLAMTLAAGAAFWGHELGSARDDAAGAYLGFTCGVLVWGWLELGYFSGYLVGPHSRPCPDPCRGWRRFALALRTSLFHEAGILGAAGVLLALSWGDPNPAGAFAFVVLWLMRWSAKLNLFLGVPNLNEHWLPEHMRFLSTYMLRRRMNLFFPVAVTGATVVLAVLVQGAATAAEPLDRIGLMLVASLLALGILEHWFLVLRLSEDALWRWALRAEEGRAVEPLHRDASAGRGTELARPDVRAPGKALLVLGAGKPDPGSWEAGAP